MSPRPLGRPRPMFASCAQGAEPHLAEELARLGGVAVEPAHLGVYFTASDEVMWRVSCYSRLANRVLIPIAEFYAPTREALYEGARRVRWDWWVHTTQTVAVDATSVDSALAHTHFISQVVKDALVDSMRDRFGERPSVDPADADLPINARLNGDHCTLSLDASGERLHRRGYREEGGAAPLKETLAALLTHMAGWRPEEPLVDLCCGSGTIVIEGAARLGRVPPNLHRAEEGRLAFTRWRSHSPDRFAAWLARAPRPALDPAAAPRVWGSDISRRQVERARLNAERAGVAALCEWRVGDLRAVAAEAAAWARPLVEARGPLAEGERAGLVLLNPPYGERLEVREGLVGFYRDLGAALKEHFAGFEAWLIVEEDSPWREIGLKPSSRTPVRNGALRCLLVSFPLRAREAREAQAGEQAGELAGELAGGEG